MIHKPLVCLDRDGTLIAERNYLKDPLKVKLLPGVARGLKRLARAGFPLVTITNQSGVGRGLLKPRDVERVNERVRSLLKARGARLDGFYWCPHRPAQSCACRKPKLALLKRAARAQGVSWRGSISVGDKPSDVAMGWRAGGKGILVLTGYGRRSPARYVKRAPDLVAKNFKVVADWIIKRSRNHA